MAEPSNSGNHREEIVAYLDGELSGEESAQVERRLASDESFRQELQSMERAWAALDELPPTAIDDRFARTTMELAVREAVAEVAQKTQALPIVRRRRRLATTLSAVAAAALSFLAIRLAWQNPNARLMADLPVIDNVDIYSQVEDVAFLRALRQQFGAELGELAKTSADFAARKERLATLASADGREKFLQKLSDEERTQLRTRANRFRELPKDEQQQLRELHAAILAAPDAGELQEAMLAYHEWLGGLPAARQFELRQAPATKRAQLVKEIHGQIQDDARLALTDQELTALIRNIRGPLEELRRKTERNPQRAEGRPSRPTSMRPLTLGQVQRLVAMQVAVGAGPGGEFRSAVSAALPERVRPAFEELPPRQQVERFFAWMRQAEALRGQISQQELERFFAEDLDAESRAELLSMTSADMQRALNQLYRRQTNAGFGRPWPPRGFDDRTRFGGPDNRGPGPPDRGGPPGSRRGFGRPGDYPPEFGPRGERPDGFGPPRDDRGFGPPPRRRPGGPPPPEGEFDRPPEDRPREDRPPP